MSDIIQLLPDSIANQIAAGEVVQRPASVVKELLENAVDAGATSVKLVVKDGGRTLVQVIDNGCGMSENDARLCFERHATSKIRNPEDLYNIRTKGFRGEALAAIAAISQVELRTRRTEDETGTRIITESSKVLTHEPYGTPAGTIFSVKNLFFNIPARRKFLKSTAVELRHITEEFIRVSLAHPDIYFYMYHNELELYLLEKGSFRQRIVSLLGKGYNERLVPLEEDTSVVKVSGFIGKPEFAKKVRGDQFFFVNYRFIKNPYLHHAVANAFDQLIPKDHHPSYFLWLDIDPGHIDINIHPAKTEIKFDDDNAVYSILRSAVRQSLGKYNISPTIDFQREPAFDILPLKEGEAVHPPTIKVDPFFNPFREDKSGKESDSFSFPPARKRKTEGWEQLYAGIMSSPPQNREAPHEFLKKQKEDASNCGAEAPGKESLNVQHEMTTSLFEQNELFEKKEHRQKNTFIQFHGKYIATVSKSGIVLIHQQRAHERVIYEKLMSYTNRKEGISQQLLFPKTLEFPVSEFEMLKKFLPELQSFGFDIAEFGKNTFVVNGIPADTADTDLDSLFGDLSVECRQLITNQHEVKEKLAFSLARSMAVKTGRKLSEEEMEYLASVLFATEIPYSSPGGKPTLITIRAEEIDKKFS